jgi:uridylate kinase
MEKQPTRVILKLTGELFSSPGRNIDFDQYDAVAKTLIEIRRRSSIQLAMVVGGGNIFRGRQEADSVVDYVDADSIGMLATVQNGIGLRGALVNNGEPDTRLMIAFDLPEFGEHYIIPKARHHLDSGRMIIIAGGLGRPGFTTDSAVAQCAGELKCRMVLKASTVDGVYDSDPRKNPQAQRFERISFTDTLQKQLQVMDATAFAMCMRSNIPIFVFNINDLSRIPQAINGDHSFGTLVTN